MIPLVRAFTTYFYLANVAEQVHRIDQLGIDELGLAATVDRVLEAGVEPEVLAEVLRRLEMRPVFTAHPTEAARRSILTKTAHLAELIGRRLTAGDADLALVDRRTAELIDQIWQTDELRLEKPNPVEEARSALYYLVQIASEVMPALSERVALEIARLGVVRRQEPDPIRVLGRRRPGWEPRRDTGDHLGDSSCSSTIAASAISSG